ncbi:MAG: DNA translocase FtsK [Bacillales bacterium]|nr:DNA translocase FtsK [Bacillales bacterium]
MKDKKMKKPSNGENKLFGNDVECLLIGLIIILISIIGLLNKGPVGHFLTYICVYLFGAFYFLLFIISFIFGLYLMIKKKTPRISINMKLLGFILVFISALIASSGTSDLKFSQFVVVFNQQYMADISEKLFVINSLSNIVIVGGGFIGFMLRALLNTCVTHIGTMIICIVFFVTGIILLFKDVFAYIIRFFMNFKWRKEKKLEERKVELTPKEEKKETLDEEKEDKKVEVKEEKVEEAKDEENKIEDHIFEEVEELSSPISSMNSSSFFIDDLESIDEDTKVVELFEEPKEEEEKVESIIKDIEVEELNKVDSFKEEDEELFEEKKIEIEELTNNNEPFINQVEEVEPIKEEPKEIKVQEKVKKKLPYVLPPLDLLKYHPSEDTHYENERVAQERLLKINRTFENFRIGAQVISYTIGPSVTRFNIKMNDGVKVNTLNGVTDDVSVALNGNKTVRVQLVVEGRDTSSIEVGNVKADSVSFRECYEQIKDKNSIKDRLLIPLGKDIEGKVITTHMDSLPHLLVAGTTGSGKSVFVNTIITTWLMRNSPDELKLLLVDPKTVEFKKYQGLPHLVCPIITTSKEGNIALKKMCEIMDKRYELLSDVGASKISEYNEMAEELKLDKLSNIVIIIDEYADFLSDLSCKKEIESSVQRLAQKARACGIYLIICTQRPTTDVITGTIKAVIPSRIGLLVPTGIDSKTILDSVGAESLLGYGDMLCLLPGHSSLVRVQGSYISNLEIKNICDYIRNQRSVEYDEAFLNLKTQGEVAGNIGSSGRKKELDVLHEQVKAHVIRTRIASTSNLQSEFSIGYSRADHILNCLEDEGIICRTKNGNRRIVIAKAEDLDNNN